MTNSRLIVIASFLVVIVVIGVVGYMAIEGWGFFDSLYMVVITLTSVGFMEVHDLSFKGQLFTIVLIVFGMGILLLGITSLTAFLVEGKLSEILRRKKMVKRINSLRNHYIVCGAGEIGQNIIEELQKIGSPLVVIDMDEAACKALEEKNILFVKGDATSIASLKDANQEMAKGLFCALKGDADNLLLVMTARGINPKIRIISKGRKEESREKMLRAGADGVVLPQFIGGMRMASEMVRPAAVTFLDKMLKSKEGAVRVEDVIVGRQSGLIGKKLKDCSFYGVEGLLMVALGRGDEYKINPSKEERMEGGDVLIFIGQEERIQAIRDLAGS